MTAGINYRTLQAKACKVFHKEPQLHEAQAQSYGHIQNDIHSDCNYTIYMSSALSTNISIHILKMKKVSLCE